MNKNIAFFDFDGTITTKDTLIEFIKFVHGNANFYIGICINSFWLVAYKLRIVTSTFAKEKLITYFFAKINIIDFNNYCEIFVLKNLSHLIRPKVLKRIKYFQNTGTEVVIVSASAENWISPWATQMNIKVLATQLAIKRNSITGKIIGKNCNGQEKANRIIAAFNLKEYDAIYCYGNSAGDNAMLALATAFLPID